jgi:hypothetical protein
MKRHAWIGLLAGILVLMASGCAMQPMSATAEPAAAPPQEVAVAYEEAPGLPNLGGGADSAAAATAATVEQMVIRTATLDLIVPDTEEALAQIQDLTEEMGGYVVSLNTYQFEKGVQAHATLRVPAEAFDAALEQLNALATTVREETVSSDEVTDEYVDLESRLRHLRAKEEQLLEFLAEAEDTEAVLAVYEQVSYTQQEIEQVTGRMQYLQNQAALATINVSLTPDALAQPLEVGGWNLPGTVRGAVEALLDLLEFFVKAVIVFVIVVLPALVLFAAPVVGLVFLIRWLVRRAKRRKAA